LLIEIKACLVALQQVYLESKIVQHDHDPFLPFSREDPLYRFEPFLSSHLHIAPLDNGLRAKQLPQYRYHIFLPALHPEGKTLEAQDPFILVYDKARKEIPFAIDNAKGASFGPPEGEAVHEGLLDPAMKEDPVYLLVLEGQDPYGNLRTIIDITLSDESSSTVYYIYDIPVGVAFIDGRYLIVEDPEMSPSEPCGTAIADLYPGGLQDLYSFRYLISPFKGIKFHILI